MPLWGDPWLPDGTSYGEGNHVRVYADLGGEQGYQSADDLFFTVSSTLTFDYPYDFTAGPFLSTDQQQAGMTQMFFVINRLHDLFYDHGFDETAGNAQESNYGRGGEEGDRMNGEALDFGGTSNANMYPPSDGSHPRMQMYRYTISGADTCPYRRPRRRRTTAASPRASIPPSSMSPATWSWRPTREPAGTPRTAAPPMSPRSPT